MNDHHYRTDFENLRVPQLERIYTGVSHKREMLQQKMAEDMGRPGYHDILPRNYNILPINKCSLHDKALLEELHQNCFACFWTMEKKKAEAKDTLEYYHASFKWYSIRNAMNDDQLNELFQKLESRYHQRISTTKIIQALIEAPNFLDEVIL